jgi:hypothetical protein
MQRKGGLTTDSRGVWQIQFRGTDLGYHCRVRAQTKALEGKPVWGASRVYQSESELFADLPGAVEAAFASAEKLEEGELYE